MHGRGVGTAVLEILDDGAFCEPRSSGIQTLYVHFSEAIDPATFTPGSVQIGGLDANGHAIDLGGITIATFTPANDMGMITFSPALPDCAKYRVRITGVQSPSGEPVANNSERIIAALACDVSGDYRVNATDVSRVRAARTKRIDPNNPRQVRADVTVDGRVNATDLSRVRAKRTHDIRGIPEPGLQSEPYVEESGHVIMEAEGYHANASQGSHSWVFVTGPAGYSGDGAMRALPDTGASIETDYVDNSPRLDFLVDFQTPGTYTVRVRGNTSSGDDDCVHVGLDGSAVATSAGIGEFSHGEWFWEDALSGGQLATLEIEATGLHTINVWMCEDGFVFDQIELVFVPTAPVHPIVLFTPDDVPQIRQRLADGNMGWIIMSHLQRNAATGDFLARGLYSILTDDLTFAQAAVSSLVSRASGNFGGSWLNNGGLLYDVAMGYDLLYNYMSESQRDYVRSRLEILGEAMYNHDLCVGDGFCFENGNWLVHVWGSMALAGYALEQENPALVEKWIVRGRQITLMYLDNTFDPDGADYEAMCRYLNMSMLKAMMIIGAEGRRGNDYTHYRDGMANKLVEFAVYMLVPYEHQSGRPIDWHVFWVPYDDSFATSSDPVSLWGVIASLTQDPLAQWLFETIAPTTPQPYVQDPLAGAIFYDPNVPAAHPDGQLPLARAYWGHDSNYMGEWSSGHVFMRTGFDDKEIVIFSAQCGDTGGWHGHVDQTGFFLYAYGDKLVFDPAIKGSYHSGLNNFMKGQDCHNIVLIDGESVPFYTVGDVISWPMEYYRDGGKIDGFIHTEYLDFVSMDFVSGLLLNPVFDDFERAKRYAMFFREPNNHAFVVIVDDVIEDDANHLYEWLLHPDDKHVIVKEGPGQFVFEGVPTSGAGFEYSGEVDLKIRVIEPQDPSHRTASFPGYGVTYLRVFSQDQRVRGLFLTILYPKKKTGMTMPTITEIRDGTVIGAQIGEDIVLFNKDRDGTINTAGVQSDGELVALRIAGGVVLKAIVMNGTYLNVGGTPTPFEAPGPRSFP